MFIFVLCFSMLLDGLWSLHWRGFDGFVGGSLVVCLGLLGTLWWGSCFGYR